MSQSNKILETRQINDIHNKTGKSLGFIILFSVTHFLQEFN